MENPDRVTYFAATDTRGKRVPFGIKAKDRTRHMYVIGKTGMGKSTLLENLAIQDIRNGEGIAFIDPHGSTAEKILEFVPEHRKEDVLYFAPFDMDYPIAFNVMEDVGYDKRHLVVSGLMSAFKKIWVDAWSARMEYILSNTLLALLEYPDSTLLSVNRMLIDKAYRKKVVEYVTDPLVKSFWADEFANYTDRYTQDATPAIQNKIGQFTSNPLIRNIVGQPNSTFDLRKMMDEKKILIINLSKGRVGETNASLLGSMLVTKIYLAAMSRADVSGKTLTTLPNFYFYVDEFQSFANESFADILSEARKYKLNLIIAHQYIEQMEEEVRNAVFGNVGTTVTFRVGPFDAEVLETVFAPKFTSEDLVNLGFAQVYLTLMIDGVGSSPFSAVTLPPFEPPPESLVGEIVELSRVRFGAPRASVEDAIKVWQGPTVIPLEESRPKRPPVRQAPAMQAPSRPVEVRAPSRPTPPRESAHRPVPTVVEPRRPVVPSSPRPFTPPRPAQAEPRPERPPLEGATSLKDAIAAATRVPVQPKPPREEPRTSGGLREALSAVVPNQAHPPRKHRPEVKGEGGHEAADWRRATPPDASAPKNMPTGKEGEVPEEVLRNVLRVDEGK